MKLFTKEQVDKIVEVSAKRMATVRGMTLDEVKFREELEKAE